MLLTQQDSRGRALTSCREGDIKSCVEACISRHWQLRDSLWMPCTGEAFRSYVALSDLLRFLAEFFSIHACGWKHLNSTSLVTLISSGEAELCIHKVIRGRRELSYGGSYKKPKFRNSLVVQWLEPCAPSEGPGSVACWGNKIPQAMWP